MRKNVIGLILILNIIYFNQLLLNATTQDEIEAVQKELDDGVKDILKYDQQIEKIDQKTKENQIEIDQLNQEIEKIQEDVPDLKNKVDKLLVIYQKIDKSNYLIEVLFTDEVENRSEKIQQLKMFYKIINQEIDQLVDRYKEVADKKTKVEKKQNDIELEKKEIDKKIESTYNIQDDLNSQLTKLEKELDLKIIEYSSNGYITSQEAKEELMKSVGISSSDYDYVDYIINRESSWNYLAVNSMSGAYGLCQALPGEKMSSTGSDWKTNPQTQMSWCNDYAIDRYGSWEGAYNFWLSHDWW